MDAVLEVFSLIFTQTRKEHIVACFSRDIYGVLGIFVFGSLVTQLLTDTSKYTIGELAMPTMKYVKRFLPRQT